jgi:hypothetical protein
MIRLKMNRFFLTAILMCSYIVLMAQKDKGEEIIFCPPTLIEDQLPNLGLPMAKDAETFVIYDVPTNRAKLEQPFLGTYSHHAHLATLNGVVVLTWSNHFADEDSPGQYVRYAISKDNGRTWINPNPKIEYGTKYGAVLFPPMEVPIRNPQNEEKDKKRVSNLENPLLGHRPHDKCGSGIKDSKDSYRNDNCGFYHLEMCANGFAIIDGKLYAIAEVAKGINAVGIGRIAREIDSKGNLGEIFWLNEDVPDLSKITPNAINLKLYNNLVYKKELSISIMEYLKNPLYMPQWDFYHKGWVQLDGKVHADWQTDKGVKGHEPTYAYLMKNGAYARLWRVKDDNINAQFSYDKGKSWTNLERTNFPDCGSRACVGNLLDGRSYVVNNPYKHGRNPLVLSISEDGKKFDKAYIIRDGDSGEIDKSGRAKNAGYQYPHSIISGEYLIIAYSINKESIATTRIPLKTLK